MTPTATAPPAAGPSTPAAKTPVHGTRPEQLAASHKRAKGPSLYHNLLPLIPAKPSYLATFLSSFPFLQLSPPQIQAIYDEMTRTVWVQQDDDMVLLWRRGFFGKGTLSRSEPSWKRRVENKIAELEGREKKLTSEEVTALRRIERKATKHVKKLEREAEKLLAASAAASERGSSIGTPLSSTSDATLGGDGGEDVAVGTAGEEQLAAKLDQIVEEQAGGAEAAPEADAVVEEKGIQEPPPLWHLGAEHTQLQPEEAFFLLFSLGSLSLTTASPYTPDSTSPPLSILAAWQLFLRDSAILLQPLPNPTAGLKLDPKDDPRLSRFDSPFLIAYASYHHFRSMGWVVRSGVKFCCEWVLYGQGGPVGGHAEFAVVVVPNYADPADAETSPFRSSLVSDHLGEGETKMSWRWFNTINRVCSGVKKTLVLLHVLIPPQSSLPSPNFLAENPAQAIAMLQMREVTIRRFLAGRSRD